MRVRVPLVGRLAAACVLVTLSPCALAETAAVPALSVALAEPEPGAVQRAKALFEKGVAAYSTGRYYEAIEIFTETDRLYPNPQIVFNIAKAYDQLGSKSGSLSYYRDYLRRSPEATDRAPIEARVRELETALAVDGVQQLSVISDPPEALVLLDERPVGLTPWTGLTWPGKHRLELRRADYQSDAFVTEVVAHRSSEVKVVLHANTAQATKELKSGQARPKSRTDRHSVLTWAALATGGAALGTAVAIEAASDSSSSSIRPGTAFFAGLGTAASIVGGVLLYFKSNDTTGATETRGKLALKVTPKSYSARFTAQF
jgi:tetratricopeptide (TPR) repeat protein